MKSKTILIVEDDVFIAESHKDTLKDFGINTILIAYTKPEAIIFLEEHEIDLALLDVRIDTRDEGIELGNLIAEKYSIPFIYLTAHSDIDTVQKIVASNPVSYLSKPIRKSDLYVAVSLAFQEAEKDSEEEIVNLQNGKSIIRFNKRDFMYAQSSDNYIKIRLNNENKQLLIRMTLTNLEEKLKDTDYKRVSRFYIVNTHYITKLSAKHIVINDEKISISKEKYDELVQTMNQE